MYHGGALRERGQRVVGARAPRAAARCTSPCSVNGNARGSRGEAAGWTTSAAPLPLPTPQNRTRPEGPDAGEQGARGAILPPDAEVDDLLVVPPEAVAPIKTSAQLRLEEEWRRAIARWAFPCAHDAYTTSPARGPPACGAADPAAAQLR